jgi:hypothetical protein
MRSSLAALLLLLAACGTRAQEAGLQAGIYRGSYASVLDLADDEPERTVVLDRFRIPAGVPEDHFGLLIHGALKVDEAGTYQFHLTSDDGSRLYIGRDLIVDNDYGHSQKTVSGEVKLDSGWHPILVAYFEGVVDQHLSLEWSGPGLERQEISPECLVQHPRVVEFPTGSRAVSWLLKGRKGEPLSVAFAARRAFAANELQFRAVRADRPDEDVPGTIARLSEAGTRIQSPLADCSFPVNAGTDAFRLDFPQMPADYLRIDLLGPSALRLGDLRCNDSTMVVVDARDAPELLPVGRQMIATLGENYGGMLELLDGPGFQPPGTITLTFRAGIKNPAFASGGGITLSSDWFAKRPGDVGVVVHEVAHIMQRYPVGKPSWLIEGIADYVRHQANLNDGWRAPTKPRPEWSYTQGYGITTGFLLYVEKHHSKDVVMVMNRALRARTYNDGLWEKLTGMTVDKLWSEYQQTAK